VKEFVTAAKEIEDEESGEDGVVEFAIDGTMCTAYRPGDGQIAVLMATTGPHASENEQIAGFINFFVSVLDEGSHSYIVSRLLDRTDVFGMKELNDISEYLMEQWSGRPTKSSSGSTGSRRKTGRSSTAKQPVGA
jgi:hypothetical protein